MRWRGWRGSSSSSRTTRIKLDCCNMLVLGVTPVSIRQPSLRPTQTAFVGHPREVLHQGQRTLPAPAGAHRRDAGHGSRRIRGDVRQCSAAGTDELLLLDGSAVTVLQHDTGHARLQVLRASARRPSTPFHARKLSISATRSSCSPTTGTRASSAGW